MIIDLKERHNSTIAKKLDIWLRIVGSRIHNKLVVLWRKRRKDEQIYVMLVKVI